MAAFKVKGMYYSGAYDWAAISSYGFNTLYLDVGDISTMNTIAAAGGKVWAQPGGWNDSSGSFSRTNATIIPQCQAAWATGAVDKFYIADEPTYSTAHFNTILARTQAIKAAIPGAQTIISTWDTNVIANMVGCADAVALDGYPIQSSTTINANVIPNQASAADKAGWPYYGVIQAFTDGTSTYPWPTAAQVQTMINQWKATNQVGYIVYQWGGTAPMLQNMPAVLSVLQTFNNSTPSGGVVTNDPFPVQGILSTFTGANEDPLYETGKWSGPVEATGATQCQRLSNSAASDSTTPPSESLWVTSVGPDCEAYLDSVPTLPGAGNSVGVFGRIQNPGNSSTAAFYDFIWTNGTGYRFFKMTAGGTFTQIGSTVTTHTMAAGEGIGFSVKGSNPVTLQGYYKSGGTWIACTNATDASSPITAAGFIGIFLGDTTVRADGFGGGSLNLAPTTVSINGTPASTFSVDSSTQVTATIGPGTTTGTISIITPNGTATSGSNFTVTVPNVITGARRLMMGQG